MPHHRIVLPAEVVKAVEGRWVPLDPVLREAREHLPRQGKKVFRFAGRGGKDLSVAAVSGRVIRLAKQANVRLTMHSLR